MASFKEDNDNVNESPHPYRSIVMPQHTTNNPYGQNWETDHHATFVCRICKKTFYNATALQNHNNTHHDGQTLVSDGDVHAQPICDGQHYSGFKFIPFKDVDKSTDSIHDGITTRTFSSDTTYIIVTAGAAYEDDTSQACKEVPVKPPVDLSGPFTCTFPTPLGPEQQCRQMFFNCCDYSLHYREEHTKRRKAALRCQVCEKRLDREVNPIALTAQMQVVSQVPFACRICEQTFHDSALYDEHNRLVHAKMKPHQCPLCPKRFTQQGGLHQHMRMHSGIRPFACAFCPKTFTQKAGLHQHLRTHTKVKPFQCVICSKSFSQSVHLRQHMRTHTNIQPFECSVCGRRFKQSSHLNFHMRSHVSDGTLPMEAYARVIEQQNQLEFLNLANVQPVQDGEIMYYAAEIAPPIQPHGYDYEAQLVIPEDMLSL